MWVSEDSLGWRLCREAACFNEGQKRTALGSKERPTGTSLESLGGAQCWGLERPAQQRREEAGGGAAGPARPRRRGRGLPQGSAGGGAGEQRGGRDRLRPLKTSPEPPQGAPEVFVAGRHLLQQAGDVEGTGTHAGCAAGLRDRKSVV